SAPRRANKEDFSGRRTSVEKCRGGREPGGSGGGSNNAEHAAFLLPDAVPETRDPIALAISTHILPGNRANRLKPDRTSTYRWLGSCVSVVGSDFGRITRLR